MAELSCILRTAKIKTRGKITQAVEHNLRLRFQPNINTKLTPTNKVVFNSLNASITDAADLQKKLSAYYDGLGVKEKSDNVLMMEFVVSASPAFFKPRDDKKIDAWTKSQLDFFKKEYGSQLKMGVLHLDEKTPHLHFFISTEMKSVKKYRNQKGEFFKESCSLNAKRYNQIYLRDLHDRYAKHNAHFGLIRGVRGSKKKHRELKEFYDLVDEALDTDYQKIVGQLLSYFIQGLGLVNTKTKVQELFKTRVTPRLQLLVKNHLALKKDTKANREREYALLQTLQKRAEKEIAEALAQQMHYGKGLKTIADLRNENKELRAENNLQKAVITSQAKKIIELERARTVENAGAGQAGRKIKLDK
ncbi:plasmid recombination protein [Acidovorax sp. SUPP2825]|uniref:plasmid recombination protein n=1 Tax=Acidovorax sp. SUPP2825 TaxID=2920879 RepID=UPI0023DE2B42|nr:plasmid recombination protein [Acidovorax sp. SUPP2825]GKS97176.1 plasmid recombination protein [Acidovorax sp. SUPP2825]